MDIKNLNTFIYVAELGSFSRAGEALGYSQPTISVQMRQLEQELGGKLFDRIGHSVRLTVKGKELLPYAQSICQISRQLLHKASDTSQPKGVLRLGIADSLCAPLVTGCFSQFHAQYPDIHLEVQTGGTTALFEMLDHNEVDLVCTLDSHIYDTNYQIAHEVRIGVHFVASPLHPLAAQKDLRLKSLLDQPFLLTERGMSYRRILDEQLAQQSLQLQPVLVMSSADQLCSLVAQNAGISFLPDYVTEDAVARGQVKQLQIRDFEVHVWGQLLYRRDKWISPAMQVLMDHLRQIQI